IDYATLTKIYGEDPQPEKRYSPAKCLGCKWEVVTGQPTRNIFPRLMLSARVSPCGCRSAGSRGSRMRSQKTIENHAAPVALYFMYYNFGRVHQTLRVTPAMEAGVGDHVWTIEEIVGLLEAR